MFAHLSPFRSQWQFRSLRFWGLQNSVHRIAGSAYQLVIGVASRHCQPACRQSDQSTSGQRSPRFAETNAGPAALSCWGRRPKLFTIGRVYLPITKADVQSRQVLTCIAGIADVGGRGELARNPRRKDAALVTLT